MFFAPGGVVPATGQSVSMVVKPADVRTMQSLVKLRQRTLGGTEESVRDDIARELGYASWAAVERLADMTARLEEKISEGLCILLEKSRVDPSKMTDFERVPLLWEVRKRDVVAWWRSQEDKRAGHYPGTEVKRASVKELNEQVPQRFMGFRYRGDRELPDSIELLTWCDEQQLPFPDIAWINGECVTPEVLFFYGRHS